LCSCSDLETRVPIYSNGSTHFNPALQQCSHMHVGCVHSRRKGRKTIIWVEFVTFAPLLRRQHVVEDEVEPLGKPISGELSRKYSAMWIYIILTRSNFIFLCTLPGKGVAGNKIFLSQSKSSKFQGLLVDPHSFQSHEREYLFELHRNHAYTGQEGFSL